MGNTSNRHTLNNIAGVGVNLCTCTKDSTCSICPSRAPTYANLPEPKRMPLAAPNVEMHTKTGIKKAMLGITSSAQL